VKQGTILPQRVIDAGDGIGLRRAETTATMKVMAVTELRAVLSRPSGRYSGFERSG
jgi:hypothetical protein